MNEHVAVAPSATCVICSTGNWRTYMNWFRWFRRCNVASVSSKPKRRGLEPLSVSPIQVVFSYSARSQIGTGRQSWFPRLSRLSVTSSGTAIWADDRSSSGSTTTGERNATHTTVWWRSSTGHQIRYSNTDSHESFLRCSVETVSGFSDRSYPRYCVIRRTRDPLEQLLTTAIDPTPPVADRGWSTRQFSPMGKIRITANWSSGWNSSDSSWKDILFYTIVHFN